MHISRIDIQNFKLFDQRSFTFHPRFNLAVGINSSGKTSLLKAIAKVLSSEFQAYGEEYPLNQDDIREIGYTIGSSVRFEQANVVNVIAEIDDLNEKRNVKAYFVNSPTVPASLRNHFGEAVTKVLALDHFKQGIFPLVTFYPSHRLSKINDIEAPSAFEAATFKESRLAGYAYWFDASADAIAFQRWNIGKTLERLQGIAETGQSQTGTDWMDELTIVNYAVASCLEDAKVIRYDFKRRSMLVEWVDGKVSPFDYLSDGQRTLLAIVADIARRACILNPQLGNHVLEETPGIVLIDELDLHLHPKWQRRIIADLRRTFPQIQFICTTHSPQLIGQCKPEEIILLDQPEEEHPGQSFGMDSNWVLKHIQGADDRDPQVEERISGIFEAIEEAEFDQAEASVAALRSEIGDHPDLVEAEALIHRYTRVPESGGE